MRKWYNTKESMGGYPSEFGDETAFVELDEAQAEIDAQRKYWIKICDEIRDDKQAEIDEARKLLFEGMNVVPINKMLMKNSTDLLNWKTRVIKYLEKNKGE